MDKRREAFENFVTDLGNRHDLKFNLSRGGIYNDPRVGDMWLAWNAALDSVVIELPADSTPETFNDESLSNGFNWGVSDCREAIEGAGLKVKP